MGDNKMNKFQNTAASDRIATINAMKRQENSSYRTKSGLYDHKLQWPGKTKVKIDGECRRLMIRWFKQLAEFCDMNHHTVAMAANTLDRFVEKEPDMIWNENASHDFQLAALASLYTTIKTQEPLAFDPETMAKLCKGSVSVQEIEEMEFNILKKLGWRVNAPTAMTFAEMYIEILSPSENYERLELVYKKLIQCQLERTLEDSRFLGESASEIALTATYNAITATAIDDNNIFSCRLADLQEEIDVDFLPLNLRRIMMSHMLTSESDTISSFKASSLQSTAKKQEQQFGWLSGSPIYTSHSPRSIIMSRN